MPYEILVLPSADRDIRRLSKSPHALRSAIRTAIDGLADSPRPPRAKRLTDAEDLYRIRVRDWRVIYKVDDEGNTVIIAHVRHRKEAYRRV